MKAVLTERDRELVATFVDQVRTIIKTENIHPCSLAVLCDLSFRTTGNFFSKNAIHLKNALRIADTLGYEVVLVKRTDRKNLDQIPEVVVKVQGYKDKMKKNKYSRYKTKTPEQHGRERKRSSFREDPEHWIARYSRRKSIDEPQDDANLLGSDGGGDEV